MKKNLELKRINSKDIDLLFGWVNEKLVRKNSFVTKKVKYSDHRLWFNEAVSGKKSLILKLLLNNIPIGQVRYDKNSFYEIDYSIDEIFRKSGFGKIIIQKSIKNYLKKNNY